VDGISFIILVDSRCWFLPNIINRFSPNQEIGKVLGSGLLYHHFRTTAKGADTATYKIEIVKCG
jgi:hypothetical protein